MKLANDKNLESVASWSRALQALIIVSTGTLTYVVIHTTYFLAMFNYCGV